MSSLSDGPDDKRLQVSQYVSVFAHMGEVYVYHDLCGYILKMSADILAFLEDFREPIDPAKVCTKHSDAFGDQPPEAFVGIFLEFGCLIMPGANELETLGRMVAVKGPWNVYERRDDGSMTFYAAWGDRPLSKHHLNAAETAIWDAFDSETRLEALGADHDPDLIASLIARLAHHEVQAVKLSKVALSFYQSRQHMKPPYLTSTMPYAPYRTDAPEALAEFTELFSDENVSARIAEDLEAQTRNREGTLSHLFREGHEALGGKTYGASLVEGLSRREMLPKDTIRVLQLGGGLGHVAEAMIGALKDRGLEVSFDILEPRPALVAAQRDRLSGSGATITQGDFLEQAWPSDEYDLILASEVASELPATHLTREDIGLSEGTIDEAVLTANLPKLGEAGRIITDHGLPVTDAPEEFYLNVGAFQVLERMRSHLKESGFGLISEFGELNRYPILSIHAEHPGLSIHWGQLANLSRSLGLESDYVYTMELIGLDGDMPALTTTRSYLRALTGLMAEHGVTLAKTGYTRSMFEALCDGKVDLATIGNLKYERLEERLMGLVPYEYKTLIVGKTGIGVRSKTSLLTPGSTQTL